MCANQPKPKFTDSLLLLQASEHLGVLTASLERITDANDAFLKMVGFTREEMKAGKIDWRAMTPPEYLALDERGLAEIRNHGACVPFEKEYLLRDGSRLPILIGAVGLSSEPLEWVCWVVNLCTQREVATAEQRSLQLQVELDSELRGAYWISDISSRLLGKSSIMEVLNEILDAAIGVTGADFGGIQLLDAGVLRIVAHRNLPREVMNFFSKVSDETKAVSSAALQCRSRVIIEDVGTAELFRGTPARDVLLGAGINAVQSTPLIGLSGEIYGMLSTHFRQSGRPTERALRYLDLLAGQAGQVLENLQYAEMERRTERLRASGQLANSLAHEINNPVQALTNILMLLSQHEAVQEQGQPLIQMAREQLSRVSESVRKMLAVDHAISAPRVKGLVKLIEHMREEGGLGDKVQRKTAS